MGVERVSRSRFGNSNNDKCISNSPNPSKISNKLDRVRSTVFLERTRGRGGGGRGRGGRRQSVERWNYFKGKIGETFERRGEAHMGISERIDTTLT